MSKLIFTVSIFLYSNLVFSQVGSSENLVQSKCSMCHGLFGISSMVEAPNLAGQPQIYLSEQLKHFKNGSRKHEIMSLIAAQLSDNEIADVSKWYSDIEIFIKKAK